MSDVTTLLDAVSEVRSGSGLSRARASMTALQTLMRMSPEDKRAVAVLVAERAAPQLVDRIESGTGQDLNKEQVETVLKMFQQLDVDDLSELRTTVTDAERRGAALTDITRSAAATAATAAGPEELAPTASPPEDADDEASPEPLDDAPTEDLEAYEAAEVAEVARQESAQLDAEVEAEVAAARAQQDEELARLEAEAEVLKAEARAAQAAPTPTSSPRPARATPPATSIFDELDDRDAQDARDDADDAGEPVHTSATPDDDTPRQSHTHDRRTGVDAAAIRAALGAASSSGAALGVFRAHADDHVDEDHLLTLLPLVPDGWARRRAIIDLLDRDLLHGSDAVDAMSTLAGAGDRRFVAGSILAGGFATPAQLRGTVDDRTLDRMAARTADHDPDD